MIKQNLEEFAWFCHILAREGVTSYLEIGAYHGGTLLEVARTLPHRSKLVAVDVCYPNNLVELRKAITKCRFAGQTVDLIEGDSTAQHIVRKARKKGPYDACFVDANHTLKYVEQDFANYAPMTKIMGFHDIGWTKGFDTVEFWNHIKGGFKHEEFIAEKGKNGIGVIWL